MGGGLLLDGGDDLVSDAAIEVDDLVGDGGVMLSRKAELGREGVGNLAPVLGAQAMNVDVAQGALDNRV